MIPVLIIRVLYFLFLSKKLKTQQSINSNEVNTAGYILKAFVKLPCIKRSKAR
ncbi:hypothetical protein FVB9288_00953 [Flavobacterium sp. CECT 9288]|nr:hypothetical protein FVB9288_00953 [Flavobacterium sp. CECT 9288]